MKFKSTSTWFAVMVFAAFTATAFAADMHDTNIGTEKTEAVKAEKGKGKKPVKKHNHMEEKTGIPMPAPAIDMGKHETMKPMDRHDHMKEKQ